MLFKSNKQETKFSVPNNLYIGQDAKNRTKKIKKVQKDSILAALTMVVLVAVSVAGVQLATADHVAPQPISSGNPSCADFGTGWSELKLEGAGEMSTGGTDGTLTVVISNFVQSSSGTPGSFDWSSNIGVDAVFVKAGNSKHNLYSYSPEETLDTGLSPQAGNGNGISHISFCYDVNDDPEPTSLTIVKEVAGDTVDSWSFDYTGTGDLSILDDFTLSSTTISSLTESDLSAGTYTITENLPDNWSSAISCEDIDNTNVSVDNSQEGSSSVTINLQEGEDVTCTFTNTYTEPEPDPGTLIVKKVVDNTGGGILSAGDFSFSVNGDTAVVFNEGGGNELLGENSITVDAGTYTVTEPAVVNYIASYDNCTNVVVDENETETCTITNTYNPPDPEPSSLTIVKEVTGDDVDNWSFNFTGDISTTLTNNDTSETASDLTAGEYTITEGALPSSDWTFVGVVCIGTDSENISTSGQSVTINLQEGEDVTCTFTNNYEEPEVEPETYTIFGFKFDVQNNILTGWVIKLFQNNTEIDSDTTDENGYEFTVDEEGTYVVCEEQKSGWLQIFPENDECYTVTTDDADVNNEIGPLNFVNQEEEEETPDTLLTLVKEVVNDSGRTAVATDWTLTATGPTTISGQTGTTSVTNAVVAPGVYTISESGPGGYTQTSITCTNEDVGGTVTLEEGDEVTCTIVNNDDPITTSSSSPNLQITKTVTPTITDPDTTVDYTILVQNVGNATAINVVLEDVLPTNFTYTTTGLATQSWSLGNMAPGSSQTVTFSADVAAGTLPGNYTNRAEVSADNHGIRFDEATVTVRGVLGEEAAPVLEITKVGDKQTVNPGGTLNYTITITNTGEAPAVNLVVTDTLPAGFTLASDGSSVINWNVDLLEVGETWEVTFLVNVASGIEVPGNHMNEVSATAGNYAGQLFASYTVVSAGQVLGETGASPIEIALWLLAITILAGSAFVFKKQIILAKEEN